MRISRNINNTSIDSCIFRSVLKRSYVFFRWFYREYRLIKLNLALILSFEFDLSWDTTFIFEKYFFSFFFAKLDKS